MAQGFTSYKDLLQEMRNDLASGAWRTFASYSVNGRSFNYHSFAEWQDIYQFVIAQSAIETGVPAYQGRRKMGMGDR